MSLRAFLERAQFLFDAGCVAQMTSVCVRTMPGQPWISFTTKIVLGPREVLQDGLPSVLVDLDTLRVIRAVVEPANAKTFLEEVATGRAKRERMRHDVGHEIQFVDENGTNKPPQMGRAIQLLNRMQTSLYDLPCVAWVLSAGGPTLGNFMPRPDALKRLERQLAGQRIPFIEFSGLSRDLGLGMQGFSSNHTGSLALIAPLWTTISSTRSSLDGELNIEISSQIDSLAQRFTLAVDPVEKPRLDEKRLLTIVGDEWKVETKDSLTRRSTRLLTRPPTALSLNFDKESVETRRVGAGNLRILAHQHNDDAELESLRKSLFGVSAQHFEEGVAQLLHLCGFSAEHIAGKKEAVDIVAFADESDVLLVECTLRELDSKKLDKLGARARALEELMERRVGSTGAYVRRALFMPVGRKAVPAPTLEAVQDHGVLLVCQEELELMIEMALRGEPPMKVLSILSAAGREVVFEPSLKE